MKGSLKSDLSRSPLVYQSPHWETFLDLQVDTLKKHRSQRYDVYHHTSGSAMLYEMTHLKRLMPMLLGSV